MKLTLRPFQTTAVDELTKRLRAARRAYREEDAGYQAVSLTAVTGSGKTIIATALIEQLIFGSEEAAAAAPDSGATFLWITDSPSLNEQTQGKMLDAASAQLARYARLPIITNTFNEPVLSPGRIYFLNTQLLGENARLPQPDPTVGRPFSFWDVVTKTLDQPGVNLYLVVDEAHRGMTETIDREAANSIIQRFIKGYPEAGMPAIPIVLGISATPERFEELIAGTGRGHARWEVPAEDVRESGLIKERIAADYAEGAQRDPMALFGEAVRAWKECSEQWAAYHAAHADGELEVVPALIVQVENGTPARAGSAGRVTTTPLDEVLRVITAVQGQMTDIAFAHALETKTKLTVGAHEVRYLEPQKIAADTEARVIFFKTALGTGWDCPRAEVMFSFRRAVEPTSIAQTIGRMVRTPLARRIEEDERLNSVDIFLPHYDQHAVDRVINALRASGGAAIAEGFTKREGLASLPLREGAARLVTAIEQVPTYEVPTVRARASIHRVWDWAGELAQDGLAPNAVRDAKAQLAALLLDRMRQLAGNRAFRRALGEGGAITVSRSLFDWLDADEGASRDAESRTIPMSDGGIARLFGGAKRIISAEVANAYVNARLADDTSATQNSARLEVAALAQRSEVVTALNTAASELIDRLKGDHEAQTLALAPARQEKYRELRAVDPEPSEMPIKLSDHIEFRKGTDSWAKHLYADEAGNIALSFTSSWEKDTLTDELARPEVLGWLRNTPGKDAFLTVARRQGNEPRPFYPDFLLVREEAGDLVVDILDPHRLQDDSVEKAKGLSAYARKHHGPQLRGHIDLIAYLNGQYRRIHLEHERARAAVDHITSNGELELLYGRDL